jgi:hypothetical protein
MGMRLSNKSWKRWGYQLGILPVSMVIIGLLGREGSAQVTTVPFRVEDGEIIEIPTVQEQVEDTYFTNSQDFYHNQRFPRTLWPIFGIVENDIGADGRHINELYQELLEQQVDPFTLIRVADFPNPFTGSLATTPLFVEDPLPPPAIPRIVPGPPTAPVPGVQQPPTPQTPPSALW